MLAQVVAMEMLLVPVAPHLTVIKLSSWCLEHREVTPQLWHWEGQCSLTSSKDSVLRAKGRCLRGQPSEWVLGGCRGALAPCVRVAAPQPRQVVV